MSGKWHKLMKIRRKTCKLDFIVKDLVEYDR